MSKTSITTLGNLIEFQRGYDLPKTSFKKGDIPVISSNGILGYHNEYKIKGPGITIGRSGTVGLPHYIEENFFPHNTALYIKDFKGNLPKYIYYLLKTFSLNERGSGSGVPTMNRNHLHPLKVTAHLDFEDQINISSVLSSLDSKIEFNNRINSELERMAKLIYDYWFLQFDFPDDKGKPYKTSGGKIVWNKAIKREIPESWEVRKIGNVLKTELGGTPETKINEYWKGEIPWLNSGEIANFPIIDAEERISLEAVKNSATSIMPVGTCVLSITRHLRPSILAIEACANQSVVGIYESEKIKAPYVYPYLKSQISRLMSLRSGAQQPHINKGTVDESLIIIPSDKVLDKYYQIVEPLYNKIINSAFESGKISSLRDWLLPMLMNGQVSVGEAEGKKEEEWRMVAEGRERYK